MKNSLSSVNYQVEINVANGSAKNNFQTITINEQDFEKN